MTVEENSNDHHNRGGPKTAAGKAISSQNSIKHGLLAQHLLIQGECATDLAAFKESIYGVVSPHGALEELLVEKLIAAIWRWRRLIGIESEILDRESSFYSSSRAEQAFDGSGEQLLCLMRYESNLEKVFYRALHELGRLQALRLRRLEPSIIEPSTNGSNGPKIRFVS